MSGTSADAVDAVLIECRGGQFRQVVATEERRYPDDLRQLVLALGTGSRDCPLGTLCEIEAAVAELFSSAALGVLRRAVLKPGDIAAIGSHGQTVFHRGGAHALTLQIGDPGRIAERTGITTIGDFRRRDIALGGQGAPLVPAFHHALLAVPREPRVVLNLGGIANLTLLPGARESAVRGFDTGPGNALLDEWSRLQTGESYDRNGHLAGAGRVVPGLLAALLEAPFFALPPPKSTGRGDFRLAWARERFPGLDRLPPADVQASFVELTAATIADALDEYQPRTRRLFVCGGGIRNPYLMERLRARIPGRISIESTAAVGLDPQAVEGAAFAWLAMRALDGQTGNLPAVTGARAATILGGIYPAGRPGARSSRSVRIPPAR